MAAHRYWRFRDAAKTWRAVDAYFNVTELRCYTGLNQTGTEFALNATVVASGYLGAGYETTKANDNNTGTRWSSPNAAGSYIGVDCGSGNAYDLKSFSIMPYADGSGATMPVVLAVEYSDNNSDWTSALPSGCGMITANTTTNAVYQHFNIPTIASGGGFLLINGGMVR